MVQAVPSERRAWRGRFPSQLENHLLGAQILWRGGRPHVRAALLSRFLPLAAFHPRAKTPRTLFPTCDHISTDLYAHGPLEPHRSQMRTRVTTAGGTTA